MKIFHGELFYSTRTKNKLQVDQSEPKKYGFRENSYSKRNVKSFERKEKPVNTK